MNFLKFQSWKPCRDKFTETFFGFETDRRRAP